jgi:DNA-directed RNA polymerase
MIMEDTLKPWRTSSKPWPFERNGGHAARYLAKTIKKAMTQRIKSAEACMSYLKTIATLFGKKSLPLRWVTPANFPVLQYCRKQKTQRLKIRLNTVERLNITTSERSIDMDAQKNGISANFIHSLDGAAMMLTLEHALANGINSFRMIHDSYATVPADMPLLNRCLRDVFVAIYEDDIVRHFIEDTLSILENGEIIDLPLRPKQGNLDLKMVLKSTYFFA